MSSQYILEIQEFNNNQNFKAEILYFSFGGQEHFQKQLVAGQKVSIKEIKVHRLGDRFSTLFFIAVNKGKIFPEATIKLNDWHKGTSYIYTFNQVQMSNIEISGNLDGTGTSEIISIDFESLSIKETAPTKETIIQNPKPKIKSRR